MSQAHPPDDPYQTESDHTVTEQQTALTSQQLNDIQALVDAASTAVLLAPATGHALLDEIRRARAELDRRTEDLAFLERATLPELRRDVEHHQAGKQRWRERAERAEAALTEIRHLHKDSPMGPCPLCIDADAAAAGGDGLVPYPCPTGRLAGAQDCDPPSFPAAPAVSGAADSRPA